MTTIVPTSEEDPALYAVRFMSELAWADAGAEVSESQAERLCLEAQECMVMGRWLDLVSLMLTSADLVFSKLSDKDFECIYTVICNLVTKCETPDEALEVAKQIVTKITQEPTDKPTLRLKIMFNLHNLLENPYSRFCVYSKALELASKGKVIEHIAPSFKRIDHFLKEWNLAVFDKRALFLTIYNLLKESKSLAMDSYKILTKYLETFSGEDEHTMCEVKEKAVQAIVEFVRSPDMFQCDLLDMPAVVQLKNDPEHTLIFQLLNIFLTQRLDSYLAFYSQHSSLLENNGIIHEECVTKIRLLSLVDLTSQESSHVPYALIKETLQIEDVDVESWVVKAITAKLIDCKMDQLNEVLIVSRSTDRVFGYRQWLKLRTTLGTWRENVSGIINTIQANKIREDGSQTTHGLIVR